MSWVDNYQTLILRGDEPLDELIGFIVSGASTEELEAFISKAQAIITEDTKWKWVGMILMSQAQRSVKQRKEDGVLK